ncbi:hypothetical protein [Paramuribaculum intestinale]|uniref:hypothetical protein n=1 Tax=Paramuribaculum intestinale TaxID=2094151 RepID=UPI0032B28AF1
MGMTVADFCELTPAEFSEALTTRQRLRESGERAEWERARMMCMCILQPYAKNTLKATDVMQFPWEGGDGERATRRQLTREEEMAEFERAKKAYGLT